MNPNESQEIANVGKRTERSEAEHRAKIAQLMQRRSKLSPEEVALLRDVFCDIIDEYYEPITNFLRRGGLQGQDVDDVHQEVLLSMYKRIVEKGFPESLEAMLCTLVKGKLLNRGRAIKKSPFDTGLPPSSRLEPPQSSPDIDHILHNREVARRLVSQLSPEHQAVAQQITLKGFSHSEAAVVLGLPEGTVKSRMLAAMRALHVIAERMLPPSQRGPL